MNQKAKRIVLFIIIALVAAALDLGTKEWAKNSLARLEHPLVLTVGAEDDGKTVEQFLASGPFPDANPRDVLPLSRPLEVKPDEPYPVSRVTRDRGYYLFLDDERETLPLFVANPALKEFSKKRGEGFSMADWKAAWKDRVVRWPALIVDQFSFLDEEEAAELLEKKLAHPVSMNLPRLKGSIVVSEGEKYLLIERTIDIIPGFFRFIYAENPGAAWGILSDAPSLVRKIFLQFVSLAAMLLLLVVAYRAPDDQTASAVALAMIFGGALGNFVDRFGRHYVVDFIDMYVNTAHWPTYNVADIAISVGVGILALQVLRKKSPF